MKWLGPVVVVLVAVLAEMTVGRAAHGPEAALFFGRFHPLVVHLPIGFFLLVAAGEAATFHPKLKARVEPVLGLLIPISAAAALGAFLMGQLLALEGGFPAQALSNHRRLTMLAVIGMAACWVAFDRQHEKAGQGRWLYRGIMGATLGLLSLGAHFGGTMTRGEAYLSKYAPGPLKPLLGEAEPKKSAAGPVKAAPAGAEPLVFKDVVQPILEQYCVECHGSEKQKGKLRLDSLEELMKGGESGATVVAGLSAKSPLLQRMLLPVSDDDRMPPEGKPSPKPDALAVIEFWIERGASPTLKVKDALAPAASRALLEQAAGGGAAPSKVPGAAATTPAPDDAATPAPVDPVAAAPRDKAEPSAPDSGASTTPAAAGSDVKPEPAASPEPALPTQPAAATATHGALSGPAFLATYCTKCHGPSKQKGKLRVDSLAAMLKGGADGPALVPGSPEKSSLITRLRLPLGNDEHMPPAKEPQPSGAEVAAFTAWVRSGAGAGATAASKPAVPSTVTASATTPSSSDTTTTTAREPSSPASEPTAVAAALPPAQEKPSSAPAVGGPADPALLQSLPARVTLFSEAVEPLLREKCGKCHIKDKPAGGLDVAKHAALLEGGYSGAGVVPKDRKQSVLFARIVLPATDDERMPPEGEPALTPDEVELIGAWIDQGAPAGGPTETATLPSGAVRALSALGVKGSGPEPLAAHSGGCAACSVPGAPLSTRVAVPSLALLAGIALAFAARRRRAH
jgi:cytochrome c553